MALALPLGRVSGIHIFSVNRTLIGVDATLSFVDPHAHPRDAYAGLFADGELKFERLPSRGTIIGVRLL
jgi:hypothetical protein